MVSSGELISSAHLYATRKDIAVQVTNKVDMPVTNPLPTGCLYSNTTKTGECGTYSVVKYRSCKATRKVVNGPIIGTCVAQI